jgi:tRNA threonylcarbamoyladenosine biosynthesis protein TsaB
VQGTKNQESTARNFALALHTTTEYLELAIAQLDRSQTSTELDQNSTSGFILLDQQSWHLGRELSTQLHGCLSAFISGVIPKVNWADIAWLAIAKGIGGYTSTRMGVVTARTLAEQLDIPLYAIDCETISQHALRSLPHKSLSYSLLELAHDQWQIEAQQGIYSHWSKAVPLYQEFS